MSLGLDKPTDDRLFEAVESAQLWGMARLALRRCRQAVASCPEDARLRARLVYLEMATGSKSVERAVDELRLMENPPQDPLMTQRLIAFCWWKGGQRDHAVTYLRQILEERDDAAAHCGLGWMLEAGKAHAPAWTEFRSSEGTEGFPCRLHVGSAIVAARSSNDPGGARRLLTKMSSIRRLSFRLSGSWTGPLVFLLPLLVAFSVHWSVFDNWSATTHEVVAGAAIAVGVGAVAIQMVAARHYWQMLIFQLILVFMGWGAYLLGLQNRSGPRIASWVVALGWALFAGPAAAMWIIGMRWRARSGIRSGQSQRVT